MLLVVEDPCTERDLGSQAGPVCDCFAQTQGADATAYTFTGGKRAKFNCWECPEHRHCRTFNQPWIQCGHRDGSFRFFLFHFFFCFFHLGANFKPPQGIIKMQGGDGNGFSFVLIKRQWHRVVCLHSAERDKSKVMQLSPRDSFLQAAPRTQNGGKHHSFSISMALINCSELPLC